jgi:hypothetical protein
MGTLTCCCKEASKERCKTCQKNRTLRPERIVNVPTWRREAEDLPLFRSYEQE